LRRLDEVDARLETFTFKIPHRTPVFQVSGRYGRENVLPVCFLSPYQAKAHTTYTVV
jgi:hypothetical protein